MKTKLSLFFTLLVTALFFGGGCSSINPSAEVIEFSIRARINTPIGKLTKSDYESIIEIKEEPYHLHHRNLTDISALSACSNMQELILSYNNIVDVKPLAKLRKLKLLYLHYNQISDVSPLKELTQLETLFLNDNQLTSVEALGSLKNLRTLYLGNNPDLTKAQIAELQKALPNCEITHNAK